MTLHNELKNLLFTFYQTRDSLKKYSIFLLFVKGSFLQMMVAMLLSRHRVSLPRTSSLWYPLGARGNGHFKITWAAG